MVAVGLFGMVEALKTREQIQQLASWSFLERFGLLWSGSVNTTRLGGISLPTSEKGLTRLLSSIVGASLRKTWNGRYPFSQPTTWQLRRRSTSMGWALA
jgi:hypothetical protein